MIPTVISCVEAFRPVCLLDIHVYKAAQNNNDNMLQYEAGKNKDKRINTYEYVY